MTINLLQCLGNHEFDLGYDYLLPFLENINFPVVFANFKNNADHPLRKYVVPSIVLNVKGYKIGVIGYLTNETLEFVPNCDVEFTPEIEIIK